MTAKHRFVVLGSLAAALTGCSVSLNGGLNKFASSDTIATPDNKDSLPVQSPKPSNSPNSNSGSEMATAPESLSLSGTWATGCYQDGGNSYKKETAVISENSFSGIAFNYPNSECTSGTEEMKQRISNKFSITRVSAKESTASDILYSEMQIFVTLMSDQMVGLFNSVFPTSTPWSKGIEQDATELLATANSSDPNSRIEKIYSIFKLTGNTLCLGDKAGTSDDGTTEAKRHTKLESAGACFSKQP